MLLYHKPLQYAIRLKNNISHSFVKYGSDLFLMLLDIKLAFIL